MYHCGSRIIKTCSPISLNYFQIRGTVTSIVIAFACILVSILLRVFQPIANAVGLFLVFWTFAGVCIVSTIYIACCVPETKMRSIEDIYNELDGNKNKDVERGNENKENAVTKL